MASVRTWFASVNRNCFNCCSCRIFLFEWMLEWNLVLVDGFRLNIPEHLAFKALISKFIAENTFTFCKANKFGCKSNSLYSCQIRILDRKGLPKFIHRYTCARRTKVQQLFTCSVQIRSGFEAHNHSAWKLCVYFKIAIYNENFDPVSLCTRTVVNLMPSN